MEYVRAKCEILESDYRRVKRMHKTSLRDMKEETTSEEKKSKYILRESQIKEELEKLELKVTEEREKLRNELSEVLQQN